MPSSSEALLKAKTLLGLSDRSTLDDIKYRYRLLMKQWHPDVHPQDQDKAKEMAASINEAYKLLLEFCKHYQYDLSEESINTRAQSPADWWEKRFGPN